MHVHDLDADRADRERRYAEGLAAWHAEHDGPAHLTAAAIAACTLCDQDGYRGTQVCDHVDRTAAAERGSAACRAALTKDGDQ
ncbi:hypothetical protein A5742_25405 [Mycolicibacterium fortuitum]|uniref:Uncharacterized protein n=1 Tax=Mycolicibacterium fortuitum TaxID=1766 RepID=A0ABD6QN76_MYCFO|nr:hypothetical protein [Mycolicibacterium fortuitum]OMC46873.1 hypothetical protein A5742_25405 [Mycolicibacterium fortuitum]